MPADVPKGVLLVSLVLSLILLQPARGYAQEATFTGAVTDSTGAVLPGATITAVHEASGNTFLAVTDDRGEFRLPVRVGGYSLKAEMPGFTTVNRNLQILIGQTAVANVQLAPSIVQETVTVTGEAPLLDMTTSTIGANIDPRQMQELPLNGRNWMDLTLLAPGARRNEAGGLVQLRQAYSQTNLDGQDVTSTWHSNTDGAQPNYNRDAIAEFEVIANRFDATQGRSAGMVVNAVTKSGTNTFAGTLAGYFRSDKFNAEDFIQNRVLPYSNQQTSATYGGPIVRDRFHFFASYGFERQPQTFTYNSPYPSFNVDQHFTGRTQQFLGRLDYQFTPGTRLSARGSVYKNQYYEIGGGSAVVHPATGRPVKQLAPQYFGTFTQVLSNRTVNEIRAGASIFNQNFQPNVTWKGGAFPFSPVLNGTGVAVVLRGYTIGFFLVNDVVQETYSIRDDLTTSYDWGGRHDLKLGGEYLRFFNDFKSCRRCMGQIDARGGPVPANIESLFPVANDASTWNLAPLARITTSVTHTVSDSNYAFDIVRHVFAGWAQDDWRVSDRLTLNLGVRYDLDTNAHAEKIEFRPWLPGNLPHDTNNVAPRLGMNFRLDDRTVLRGGYGLFFAFAPNDGVQQSMENLSGFEFQIFNDGRPDFVPNWFGPAPGGEGEWGGGPKPTQAQALAQACDLNAALFERWRAQGFRGNPPCFVRSVTSEIAYPGRQTSYSHQTSVGVQRQIGADMSFEANYVYTGGRGEEHAVNANLSYNPATGANYPFSDVSRRPFPEWGPVHFEFLEGWSNYHGMDLTLTKRFGSRWQAMGSYTLGYFRDAKPIRPQWYLGDDGVVARQPVGFPLAQDMGADYSFAGRQVTPGFGQAGDQRHRAVFNGIWDVGAGFQVSGIYFYGSGERFWVDTGVDRRGEGGTGVNTGELRLLADGSILPRNSLVGKPIHKMDLRLQERLPLAGRVAVNGIFEVFNLFNHEHYGNYVVNASNANFGQPAFSPSVQYFPRMLQFGIRATF
ncbi:MAG: TonB-dependent receptor [Acidobacteria bacterium]|nr:TonB-dependent receptor [Acidobacteriota bacterium]